jgi:hypothetical protein
MKTKWLLISFALGLALALLWLLGVPRMGLSVSFANADKFPATPHRIIVKLKSELAEPSAPTGHASLDTTLARFQVQSIVPLFDATRGDTALKRDLGLSRIYALTLPPSSDLQEALAAFSADPAVEYAEPDHIGFGAGLPNDTRFGDQWGLYNTGQYGGKPDADIDAPEAWDISTGATSTILAIIDTGVDLDHPDLTGKIVPGYDFVYTDTIAQDDHGHGTHVAGIAAAVTDNGVGVAGVCPECRIMPLKALNSSNQGFYSWWASAIVHAVDDGADVINMSMGGISDSISLHDAVRYAYNADVPIVVAMMNVATSTEYYPAAFTETIAVGSTDRHDNRSSFSNYGGHIDLVAPGTSIWSTVWDDAYTTQNGTSMATPHVAGVLGLIRSIRPRYTINELRTILKTTAEDQVGPPGEDTGGWDPYFGSGRLNADRALRSVLAVITVCHGGSCDHDNIQDAVDEALDSSVIKVAAGTYTDTNNYGGLAQAVYISKSVTIQGGYTTAFTDPPDPDANPTVVNAQGNGRVFYIIGEVNPLIKGLRITGGDATGLGGGQGGADAGGGVYIVTATVTISNSRLFNNTASQGGGLYLRGGDAALNNSTISGNSVAGDGGGLYLLEGNATFSGNAIISNAAGGDGGGLYLQASDATSSEDSITSNDAGDRGGGLYLGSGDVTLINSTISGNRAVNSGGGLYLGHSNATVTISDGRVLNNTARQGGGLYLRNGKSTFSNSTVAGNSATDGGGLYLYSGAATFVNTTLSGNSAVNSGGGLYLSQSSATVTISDSRLLNNTASQGGGLHLRDGDATLNNNTISGNSVTGDGGGLYLLEGNATFSGNTIISNTAAGDGGGLYLQASDATSSGDSITSNDAGDSGGGLYLDSSDATLINSTISGNRAVNSGGGLSLAYSNVTFRGSDIISNTAGNKGGGLHLWESDAILSGNTIISNTASHDGGGLYLWTSSASFDGDDILSNDAGNRGGGLYLGFSDATLNDNTISNNHAANDGGGLCLSHSSVTLGNSTISGNSATDDGGGLLQVYGDITLGGNTISGNSATDDGGGRLHLYRNETTLVNNLVADNRVNSQGGGLYIEASLVRLLHTTIARNSGGDGSGVYTTDAFDTSSTVLLTNTILVSHTVGFFVTTGNTATLEATLWGSGDWANGSAWGGTGTIYTGTVNVWETPYFVDPDAGDYHICSASAAKDAAPNAGTSDDIDGDARPQAAGYDIGADEHTQPKAASALCVTNAFTGASALTVTLTWSTPPSAVTCTLRYSSSLITDGNWAAATVITDTLPGSASKYTATVPYTGGTIYFAFTYWNACGEESLVSGNGFWPHWDVYLPLVMRNYPSLSRSNFHEI